MNHLDLAIAKESKRTESACCAISGKAFGNQTVQTASVPQKPITLSAVSMNIDQRALQDGSSVAGNNNDSPTYGIHNHTVVNSTSSRSKVSCCGKNNLPSSRVVGDTDQGSKSLDYLENESDGIQNVETTGSDNVGNGDAVRKQDDTLTSRFIEKNNGCVARKKIMDCKQPMKKRLEASASEIIDNTKGLEKAVSPVCRIKIKVWATNAIGAMNLKNYKEWLDAIESELKNTITINSDVAVLRSVINVPLNVTSTRWAGKI